MNIYTCGCIEDDFRRKTIEEILQIFEEGRQNYVPFIRMKLRENFYICCPRIIEFCYYANRYFFLKKTCSDARCGTWVSCYDLLKFGFKSICQLCVCPLEVKLFPFLIKVK